MTDFMVWRVILLFRCSPVFYWWTWFTIIFFTTTVRKVMHSSQSCALCPFWRRWDDCLNLSCFWAFLIIYHICWIISDKTLTSRKQSVITFRSSFSTFLSLPDVMFAGLGLVYRKCFPTFLQPAPSLGINVFVWQIKFRKLYWFIIHIKITLRY